MKLAKSIINYIGLGIVFAVMYVVGLFIVPIIYKFRDYIRQNNITFLWYFLNDTTKGRDAGDFGRFKHNFIGFYKQCALRNPHWNLKLLLTPKVGKKKNIKGDLEWKRYDLKGTQICTYDIDNTTYFRFSHSTGKWYCQFGASDNRYIYKFKINI